MLGCNRIIWTCRSQSYMDLLCPPAKRYGSSLSDIRRFINRSQFTRREYLPLFSRCFQALRHCFLSWIGKSVPLSYARHQSTDSIFTDRLFENGYLLIEFIDESRGMMLSNSLPDGRHHQKPRAIPFRDLSRIFLNITRTSIPRIASFIIDRNGFLRLANRPFSIEIHQLENERIPTDIPRDYAYSTVDSYIVDILVFHDNRFRYQPNVVSNLGDCTYQLSVLPAMRTIFQSIFSRLFRRDLFVFALTDLHQTSIFVDSEWHITCLVDLEWACTQPVEMFRPPSWLTNMGVDQLDQDEYYTVLMESMATEEHALEPVTLTSSISGVSKLQLRYHERFLENRSFLVCAGASKPFRTFYDI